MKEPSLGGDIGGGGGGGEGFGGLGGGSMRPISWHAHRQVASTKPALTLTSCSRQRPPLWQFEWPEQ